MHKATPNTLAAAISLLCVASASATGLVDNSHSDLVLRNYYFDHNYLGEPPQAAAREWAQGFSRASPRVRWASTWTPKACSG